MSRIRDLLLVALSATALHAQSGQAELFGTVRDTAGTPIPGVQLTLSDAGRTASTNAEGAFHFFAIPPGAYDVAIAKEGFKSQRRTGLRIRTADRITLDFTLEIGDIAQEILVTGEAPLLQSSSATLSYVTEQRRVVTLPLDGRNFVPLIALLPGVMLPPGQLLPRINGSRPRVSEYLYDGISVLQPEPGQVAYYPIIDAIEEFRVHTNSYSAEYGRSNGGVIQVATKRGSNQLHGTLFEFFRNEALNARNLFAPATQPKPLFRRNQYGFVLGGPVQKDRTFFFLAWQGTRLKTGITRISTIPTLAQRTAATDPVAQTLLNRYPVPTSSGAANNYTRVATEATAADQFDSRIDRNFGSRHRLFTRYSFLRDDSTPATPLPDGSGNITSGLTAATLTRADSVVAEHAWTLAPEAVNQLRFGFTRRHAVRASLPGSPIYTIAGYQQLGPTAGTNGRFATSVTQIVDDFALVIGNHSLKVGTDLRWQRLDVLQPSAPNGIYAFDAAITGNALTAFAQGLVQSYTIDIQKDTLKPRAAISEFFLQDDWRVSRRLTANLGVRYTLNWPSTEAADRAAFFNLNTQKLDFAGRDEVPRTARNLEKLNFAPRLGLAFQITPSFVARAAYGMTWIEQAGITTPFTTPLFPFIQTLTQRAPDNRTPAFLLAQGPTLTPSSPNPDSGLGQGVFAVQRDNGSGYAQQWNFILQKTVGQDWSFEAGYLGSKLTRLGVPDVNLNQVRTEQLVLGNPGQFTRAFPRFNAVTLYRNNIGHSTYHALQTHLEKRFSHHFTATASYTFSKLIDDAGAVFDTALLSGPVLNYQAADSFNRRLEKDESTGSFPHVFSTGFVWELPRGFRIGGIVRAQSGFLVTVTQATNLNAPYGYGIQRPNRVADPAAITTRSTARWFNTQAFSQAPQFTLGTSSRNPVRGPSYQTADLMVGKSFRLRERLAAELRAEAFNLTNTPPLGQPNGSFGTAAFGSITTALDPRVYEIVLKVNF